MLSRNDMTVLMQQVDMGKALDLLTMFKEAGKEKIDIRTIMALRQDLHQLQARQKDGGER